MAHIPLYQPNRPTKRKLTLRQRVALLVAATAPLAIAGSALGYGLNQSGGGPSGSALTPFADSDPSARLAQILGSRPAPAPAPAPAAAPRSMPAPKPGIPPAPSQQPAPAVQDAARTLVAQPLIASVKAATVEHAAPAPPPATPTPAASPPSSPAPAVVPSSLPPVLIVRVRRPVLPDPVLPARVRPVAPPRIEEVRPPHVAAPKSRHGEKTHGNGQD